jgi:hypothetical protein
MILTENHIIFFREMNAMSATHVENGVEQPMMPPSRVGLSLSKQMYYWHKAASWIPPPPPLPEQEVEEDDESSRATAGCSKNIRKFFPHLPQEILPDDKHMPFHPTFVGESTHLMMKKKQAHL